jgi:hypothetical protein
MFPRLGSGPSKGTEAAKLGSRAGALNVGIPRTGVPGPNDKSGGGGGPESGGGLGGSFLAIMLLDW